MIPHPDSAEWHDFMAAALMAQFVALPQPMRPQPPCNCSFRIRMVGDGCPTCNPAYWEQFKHDDELIPGRDDLEDEHA